MKTAFAIIGIVSAAVAAPAQAGIVITQQDTHDDGSGKPRSSTTTIMIQGNKEKMVSENATTIIDLDKGSMLLLMPQTKTAMEMPLTDLSAMSASAGSMSQDFKRTGKTRSVAGYACEEFAGTVTLTMGAMGSTRASSVSCFAKAAPGAAEYSAFSRRMVEMMKLKMPAGGRFPEGVALANETTTQPPDMAAMYQKMGLTPQQIAQAMAGQKKPVAQVSRSTVTAIKLQSLPADTFELPPGYTRQQRPSPRAR